MAISKIASRLAALLLPSRQHREGGIRALDGVRGLAVLMVLLDHASDEQLRLFPGADLNRMGKYGVYLFFVLSAFLLTYPFLSRTAERLRDSRFWANYFLRRFLRIFPLYALVLVFVTFNGKLTPDDLWNHLLLRDGDGHFWTIPVEFKYYFVLPIVAMVFALMVRRMWLAAAGVVGGLILLLGFVFFPLERAWSLTHEVLLLETIQTFLMGSTAGAIYWWSAKAGPLPPRWRVACEVAAGGCLIAILLRIPSIWEFVIPFSRDIGKFEYDPTFCGVVWSLFLLTMLNGTGLIRRALEWAPLCYLGIISFSAYLWHRKFLSDVDDLELPSIVRLILFLALVTAVATVSYLLVEGPLSRIRLLQKKNPVLPPEAAPETPRS